MHKPGRKTTQGLWSAGRNRAGALLRPIFPPGYKTPGFSFRFSDARKRGRAGSPDGLAEGVSPPIPPPLRKKGRPGLRAVAEGADLPNAAPVLPIRTARVWGFGFAQPASFSGTAPQNLVATLLPSRIGGAFLSLQKPLPWQSSAVERRR